MFAKIFGKKTAPPPVEIAEAVPPSRRMDLEERKAFRREMLYLSIRDTFLSMEVIGSMYKFKVMPVDSRHHRFIAMIDVAKSFVTSRENKTKSFAAYEQQIRINAYKRFGILLDGSYWRVSETESQFEYHARVNDKNEISRNDRKAGPNTPLNSRLSSIGAHDYQPITEEETRAFMDALQGGYAPPAITVGDREYQSDLAPLDGGIMIGGTQYGRLQ